MQQILDQVAWQTDLEASVGTNKRLDPAKLVPEVDALYKEAWEVAVDGYDDLFIKKVADFAITGGVGANTYSLVAATDFYKLKSIQRLTGATYGPPLPTHPWNQIGDVDELSYRLQDSNPATVYFEPELSCAGTYRLYYVYQPADLTAAVDQIVDFNGAFRRYIIDALCARVLSREEEDPGFQAQLMARFTQRIAKMAATRSNAGRGKKVADVRTNRRFRFMTRTGYSLP
ncbi:MAG: hypothetical protein ABR581_04920 [Thermoleophilaceae bacterium]